MVTEIEKPDVEVILYTNECCPRCEVLKEKLDSKGIAYTEVTDFDRQELANRGFNMTPVMEYAGTQMDFSSANKWISER